MPSLDLLLSCFRSPHHQQQKKPYPPIKISKSSHTQPQSLFFSKFPLEIRHIIYSFSVPPCKNVNIFYNSWAAERAPWPSDSAEYAEMHTNTWHYPVNYKCQHRWKRQGDLRKLFLVCRKMYDEVADLLYSTRVYYFNSPVPIVHLHKNIPLHHFNRITSIRFLFCSNYAESCASEFNAEMFQSALKILQQMPNLQSFHILLAHECWRDHFFLQAHPQGDHPYHNSEFNNYRSRFLTPPPWFNSLSEVVWLRPGEVDFKLKDIIPYLQWAKDIPCRGEVVVQLHVLPHLHTMRNVGYAGNIRDRTEKSVPSEMRLKDGEFVKT